MLCGFCDFNFNNLEKERLQFQVQHYVYIQYIPLVDIHDWVIGEFG